MKNSIILKVAFFSCIFYNVVFLAAVTVFLPYFFLVYVDFNSYRSFVDSHESMYSILSAYEVLLILFCVYLPALKVFLSQKETLTPKWQQKDRIALVAFLVLGVAASFLLYSSAILAIRLNIALVWVELYSLRFLYYLYLVYQRNKQP